MVPLALWSKNVRDTDYCALADHLLAVKSAADLNRCRTEGFDFGKPKLPDSITGTTILADLVGERLGVHV